MRTGIMVARVAGQFETPTGEHTTEASRWVWGLGSWIHSPHCYFSVVRLLMQAGFCFCLCLCSAASGQITVDVQTPIEVVVQSSESDVKLDSFGIVICTSRSCGPCRVFKASPEYSKIKARVYIEEADIDKYPAWRPYATRLPTVWLIRRSDRRMLRSWTGAVTLATVTAEAKKHLDRER